MEKNNTKGYVIWFLSCALFFFLGYFIYPEVNHSKVPTGMDQMQDGEMMSDMDNGMHGNMSMRSMMKTMTSGLEGKTGEDFDSAFLEEMIPHHQGAVEMARMVLSTSKRPELIKMANDIISAQQKEIEQMRSWQRAWFGINPQ